MIDGVLYTTAGVTRNVVAIDPKTGETLVGLAPERRRAALRRGAAQDVRTRPVVLDRRRRQRAAVRRHAGVLSRRRSIPTRAGRCRASARTASSTSWSGVRGEVNDKSSIGNSSPRARDRRRRSSSARRTKSACARRRRRISKATCAASTCAPASCSGRSTRSPRRASPATRLGSNGSAESRGNAGVWARDDGRRRARLRLLAVEAPLADTWGGDRHGDNLYGNSLVCLDAKTGERVWHYQLIHHDIWDWDNPTAPMLDGSSSSTGGPMKAVAQLTKQAFVYTFDRATGEPVWPIEERPVPPTDVPGEWTSPTQPFPTKPPAFDRQGVTERRPHRLHAGAARRGASRA